MASFERHYYISIVRRCDENHFPQRVLCLLSTATSRRGDLFTRACGRRCENFPRESDPVCRDRARPEVPRSRALMSGNPNVPRRRLNYNLWTLSVVERQVTSGQIHARNHHL